MVGYKVLKPFKDKFTKKVYNPKKSDANSYSHADEERIAFLIEKGYIQEKKQKKESPKKKEEK